MDDSGFKFDEPFSLSVRTRQVATPNFNATGVGLMACRIVRGCGERGLAQAGCSRMGATSD
jgi:hypothetical protein